MLSKDRSEVEIITYSSKKDYTRKKTYSLRSISSNEDDSDVEIISIKRSKLSNSLVTNRADSLDTEDLTIRIDSSINTELDL